MTILDKTALPLLATLLVTACGGGGGSDGTGGEGSPDLLDDPTQPGANGTPPGEAPSNGIPPISTPPGETPPGGTPPNEIPPGEMPNAETPPAGMPGDAASAGYSVKLESLWFIEDYPQGFPDNAHLSYIGGATHNAAVSFWEPDGIASPGLEDLAETGRIETFLAEEVAPAIANGTADAEIARREYIFSSPETFALGLVNAATFELEMKRDWPRVTLVTMLGPSPDWFVGVDGLPLFEDGAWRDEITLDLPLHDAGSKSGMEPVMGGPDLDPALPIGLNAYDVPSGTYQSSDTPQNIARVTFTRTR